MKRLALVSSAAILAAAAVPAAATVTVNVTQSGADVVTNSSGTLDLTGLSDFGLFTLDVAISGGFPYVGTGVQDSFVEGYAPNTGPTFGDTTLTFADSGSGDSFAIFGNEAVFVDTAFVSGGSISSTATYLNTTLAALGLTEGTYTFTLPNDSVIVNIGGGGDTGAVPEPASWALMISGFGLVGGALRASRRTVSFAA